MWLSNIKIRVKKYNQGWSVEIQKEKKFFFIFKRTYWMPLICYNGSDEAFYYKTKEFAMYCAKRYFYKDLLTSIHEN